MTHSHLHDHSHVHLHRHVGVHGIGDGSGDGSGHVHVGEHPVYVAGPAAAAETKQAPLPPSPWASWPVKLAVRGLATALAGGGCLGIGALSVAVALGLLLGGE